MKTEYELSKELFNCVESFLSVSRLIKMNANPNLYHENGVTALMRAAYKKRRVATQYLLEAGASISEIDSFGRNILYYAVEDYSEDTRFLTIGDTPPSQIYSQVPISHSCKSFSCVFDNKIPHLLHGKIRIYSGIDFY